MKLLQLIWSRVKQYWITNRLIFILFLTGGILSSIMFSYFYGNMLSYMDYRTSEKRSYRSYSVDGISAEFPTDEELALTMADIDRLYEDDLVESVTVEYWFGRRSGGGDVVDGPSSLGIWGIIANVGNDITFRVMVGNGDFDANPDGVIYPDGAGRTVGDTIVIGGKTLTGIGRHTISEYYISYQTFRELKLPVDRIVLTAAERHDPGNDPVKALLEELFPDCVIDAPTSGETQANQSSVMMLTIICAVYGASMLAFMFLLRFLMDANVNHTIISRIVGAGKWKILGLCFGEAVVLCATVDLLGIGIHWILYDSVFSKLNKDAGLVYLPEDYLWIFLSMLCVGMVVALGFVVKYAALSPAASRRHAE